MKKTDLVKTAKELNKVLGLDPKIDVKQDASSLEKLILKAADLIEPEDKISDSTSELITDLRAWAGDVPKEEETKEAEDTDAEDDEDEAEDTYEDEGEEEEAPPAKSKGKDIGKGKGKSKDTGKAKAQKPEKAPGVIATIISLIEDSGKKGVTKEEILNALVEAFPDKKGESMKNTINVQVPNRINKERFPLEKIDGDRYRKAANKA